MRCIFGIKFKFNKTFFLLSVRNDFTIKRRMKKLTSIIRFILGHNVYTLRVESPGPKPLVQRNILKPCGLEEYVSDKSCKINSTESMFPIDI